MRQTPAIAVILIALPVRADENQAEKLFRAMETKVRAAKAFKLVCELEGTIDRDGEPIKVKVTQQFAGRNKARFELQTERDGQILKNFQVSDGKQMIRLEEGISAGEPQPADPNLNKDLLPVIARAGFMLPRLIQNRDKGGFNTEKLLPASNFKLGEKERIGEVDAQVIEYSVTFGAESFVFGGCKHVRVKVWIDPKKIVPLKRKVMHENLEDRFFIEAYKEFALDPKLDAKVFDLPK